MRRLSYARAIREAHAQLLAQDPRVFLIGQASGTPGMRARACRISIRNSVVSG